RGIRILEFLAAIFMLVVSVAYFRASSRSMSLTRRLVVSAHGAVGVLLFIVAFAVAGHGRPEYGVFYLCLFVVPFVLIGIALALFRGNTKVHVLQFPNI